jgi:hypothetical protein
MAARKGKERTLEKQRTQAQSIRQQASEHSATTVRRQEAEAAEMEATARKARAEADVRAAQAERLEAEAYERDRTATQSREEVDERFHHADSIDPDTESADTSAARERDLGTESTDTSPRR